MTAYLAGSGVVVDPDEASGEDPLVDFFAFLWCFFDFFAFGCVSLPVALVPASVPDSPDVADGLVELELEPAPMVSVELLPPGDMPEAPLPLVPDAPDVPLLMPDDEVPLAPDEGDEGDDDMAPAPELPIELEEEGVADLLLVLVSVPVDCASATADTDATSTNDND